MEAGGWSLEGLRIITADFFLLILMLFYLDHFSKVAVHWLKAEWWQMSTRSSANSLRNTLPS